MKNFQLFILCFICFAESYGQISSINYGRIIVNITKEKNPNRVYIKVDVKTTRTFEDSAWVQSLEKKISQSVFDNKQLKKGDYIVSVRYILTKNGNLAEVSCETDPGYGLCNDVVTSIKKSQSWKKWIPDEQPIKVSKDSAKMY